MLAARTRRMTKPSKSLVVVVDGDDASAAALMGVVRPLADVERVRTRREGVQRLRLEPPIDVIICNFDDEIGLALWSHITLRTDLRQKTILVARNASRDVVAQDRIQPRLPTALFRAVQVRLDRRRRSHTRPPKV